MSNYSKETINLIFDEVKNIQIEKVNLKTLIKCLTLLLMHLLKKSFFCCPNLPLSDF